MLMVFKIPVKQATLVLQDSENPKEDFMSSYELMLVTPTSLSKEQEGEFFKKTEDIIKKNGGKVTTTTPMGKRKLAHTISGQNEAIYTLIDFEGDGKTVIGLERALHISGEVLRQGVFKKPKLKAKEQAKAKVEGEK